MGVGTEKLERRARLTWLCRVVLIVSLSVLVLATVDLLGDGWLDQPASILAGRVGVAVVALVASCVASVVLIVFRARDKGAGGPATLTSRSARSWRRVFARLSGHVRSILPFGRRRGSGG